MPNRMIRLVTASIVAFATSAATLAQQFDTRRRGKVDQVDIYHGTEVADPYRWIEDDTSAETAAWVEAENKVTFPYLEAIPFRAQLQARVKQLNDYEKYSSPSRKGAVLLLQQERRPAEPERPLHPEGPRGHAGGPDRSEHVVGGRHDAARRVRAVEGREVRGLRHLEERLRLAAVQGDGARDEEDAARHARVGQGLGRRAGRATASTTAAIRSRRRASREGRDQRGPSASTSTRSARRSRRIARSTRTRRTRSASTPSRRPTTSGSRC